MIDRDLMPLCAEEAIAFKQITSDSTLSCTIKILRLSMDPES
jgi:hypothetical protein